MGQKVRRRSAARFRTNELTQTDSRRRRLGRFPPLPDGIRPNSLPCGWLIPEDRDGRWLKKQEELSRVAGSKRLPLFLCFSRSNALAEVARVLAIECFLNRLSQRGSRRVFDQHARPGHRLHDGPVPTRSGDDRDHHKQAGEFGQEGAHTEMCTGRSGDVNETRGFTPLTA